MANPSISLIIPCFNELDRLGIMFEGIAEFMKRWDAKVEVIIVDDGSTDGTDLFIESHPVCKQNVNAIKLVRQNNTGKGGALQNGVKASTGNFILTLDADMATSPTELLNWLTIRKQFYEKEILIGSRELPTSKVQDHGYRKVVGNIFNLLIRTITGLPFKDTQCGFKLYPAVAAKELFSQLQTMGWAHDVELLLRANRLGYAIVEMPIQWQAVEGSKISVVRDSFHMLWDVIKIARIVK
ncbi:MAG: glycosyltransferase [Bacteroidetes bacterium]|nr:glycosyltransferase [Bacteroidota bacterium]